MKRTLGVVGLVVLALGVPQTAMAARDGVVMTEAGKVRGAEVNGVQAFQGIPYAAPPVGERRWRAPERAAAWSGVRDAAEPGAMCPQMGRGEDGLPTAVGNEDCLSLNVWKPKQGRNLPVLVFVAGGGFTSGAGSQYGPAELVARGNVVVTLNYRLGALGFLAHPGLKDPAAGNFGLADQQAALRWVQRNVAAFGGDASRVTLWGQSAGAFSVCAQLVSPSARGLFQRAIVQSGPCANDLLPRMTALRRGVQTAASLGCATVECLRDKPFQELTGLNEDGSKLARISTDRPWLPVAGTPIVPLQPLVAQRLGLGAAVPIIQGGTKDEMRSFVGSRYDGSGRPLTAEEYPGIVRELYGARLAEKVLAQYPAADYPRPSLALAQALTDEGKLLGACTQLVANDAMSRRTPVYAYEFAEPGETLPGEFPYGANHSIDLQYFFDTPWASEPLTGDQAKLQERLLDQWTAFARTGRPGWPEYRKDVVRSISASTSGPINLRADHRCDFWAP